MHPTYLFYTLIVIDILCFFRTDFLYKQTIFFVPFSATSFLNYSMNAHIVGFQPVFLSAFFWIASYSIKSVCRCDRKRMVVSKNILLFVIFAAAFLLACFFSVFSNYFFHPFDKYILDTQVYYSPFTQIIYVLFGLMLTFFIAIYNDNIDMILSSIKVIIISGGFVAFWGVFQFVLYHLNIGYPDFIFNNSGSVYAQGYTQMLTEIGLKRISSVAVEPSILGQFLIIPAGLLLGAKKFSLNFFSRPVDSFLLILTTAILILSTSSSAVISFVLLLAMCYFYKKKIKIHFVCLEAFVICILVVFVYAFIPVVRNYLDLFILHKLATFSGYDRFNTIKDAYKVFLENPLFGHGWGSARCHDLIFLLLATAGLFGFIPFASFIGSIAYKLNRLNFSLVSACRNNVYITYFSFSFFHLIY